LPVFVWTIDHPAGLVLVDTGDDRFKARGRRYEPGAAPREHPARRGLRHQHPPAFRPLRRQPPLPARADPRPGRELADARSHGDYTIREWVDFDGATYVEHDGEVELLPGIRLLPAPGHTDRHQVVVVETGAGTNVLGGDVGVWFGDLGSGTTEGQRRVLALGAPAWLSHAPGPNIPQHRP
jgi:N-acyl homoserine lactone hydrolase